jgi:hypothetical protein
MVQMSVCTKLGPRPRGPTYAGCVVLRSCLRAQRTHQCTLAIVDPITSAHCHNECLYKFGVRPVQPFDRICWICGAASTFVRAARASMRTRTENTQLFFWLRATRDMRAARAPHSNFALAAVAAPCSIPVLSRFALVLALRARCRALRAVTRSARARGGGPPPWARGARCAHASPITCAHCPNGFLYQFGVQSVQPIGRQCGICGAARTFARAARASMRTRNRRPP